MLVPEAAGDQTLIVDVPLDWIVPDSNWRIAVAGSAGRICRLQVQPVCLVAISVCETGIGPRQGRERNRVCISGRADQDESSQRGAEN